MTVLFSVRDPVPNAVLDGVVQRELERVGAPRFDPSEVEFAKAMQKELGLEAAGLGAVPNRQIGRPRRAADSGLHHRVS